jgi:hypothetical protein
MIKLHLSMLNTILGEMVYCPAMISSGFILILPLISPRLYGVILGILGLRGISSSKISLRIQYSIRIYPGVNSIRISSFTIFCLIYWRKSKFPRLFLIFYSDCQQIVRWINNCVTFGVTTQVRRANRIYRFS